MLFLLPIGQRIKVSVWNRVLAKMIDFILVMTFAVIVPYPLGPLLGFLYSLCADGLNVGPLRSQSVGKKLMKLKVTNRLRKEPAGIRDSVLRNAPVGIVTFFAIIPIWGWIIVALIGLPLMIMEIYLMISVETGHRLGDVMSDTEVLEVS
jgi:uncharacterized RDD family membrane protein YckC